MSSDSVDLDGLDGLDALDALDGPVPWLPDDRRAALKARLIGDAAWKA